MQKLTIKEDERTICVVFGSDATRNKQLFTAAIRMPGYPRIIVIGETIPDVQKYRDITGPNSCEIWPVGTEIPPLGRNAMLLDGRIDPATNA